MRSACIILAAIAATPVHTQTSAVRRGDLLIATHRTRDTAFAESVIVVLQHDRTRSAGLVINRRLGEPVATLFPDLKNSAAGRDPLWAGGPVAIGVNALMRSNGRLASAAMLIPGVYLIAERQQIRDLLARRSAASDIRVYVGLCSWGPGQLDDELGRGLWRTITAKAELIFDDSPETLWPRLSKPR